MSNWPTGRHAASQPETPQPAPEPAWPIQEPPAYYPPAAYGPPQPPKPKRHPWRAVAFVALGFFSGLLVANIGGGSTTPAVPAPKPAAVAPAAPAKPAPAPTAADPASTVSDGTYEVGTDMAKGRYKTSGPTGSGELAMCYVSRASDDSHELEKIIANQIVQGPGSVTVKTGEFVEFSGGCTWTQK